MSYNTLATQVEDADLAERVDAAANQEARNNPAVSGSMKAQQIINNGAGATAYFMWPVALNTEAEYAAALAAEVPNPGADESVIADAMILAAVQGSWPADPVASPGNS